MIVVGLTGSIGMGKTTTAALFAEAGAPVHDADAVVHALYAAGGAAVAPIGEVFPQAVSDGAVNRPALSARVLGDPAALKTLEAIVHPLVAAARAAFFEQARAQGAAIVVLDIPLLFETGGDADVDAIVVVTAPAEIQRQRVLGRPGMTLDKLDAILARQAPDAEKRAHAHYVIDTSQGLDAARAQVRAVLSQLRALEAGGEPPHS